MPKWACGKFQFRLRFGRARLAVCTRILGFAFARWRQSGHYLFFHLEPRRRCHICLLNRDELSRSAGLTTKGCMCYVRTNYKPLFNHIIYNKKNSDTMDEEIWLIFHLLVNSTDRYRVTIRKNRYCVTRMGSWASRIDVTFSPFSIIQAKWFSAPKIFISILSNRYIKK